MTAIGLIKKHEGFRSKPYRDTVGVLTVGYGFNLEQIELPKPVAELWLSFEVEKHEKSLRKFDWYNQLDTNRRDALLSMHYNLGATRFRSFKKMIRAFEMEDYDTAAKEMLDSKWAQQVGDRATELAAIVAADDNIGI